MRSSVSGRVVAGAFVLCVAAHSPLDAAPPPAAAYVRVVHAVPDAPAADVYLGSKKVLPRVAYKTVSRYLRLPPGTHRVRLTPVGRTDAVLEIPLTVRAGSRYTAAAAGTLSTLRAVVSEDRSAGPGSRTTGQVRVVHLAPDAPKLDVSADASPKPLFAAVAFGQATGYVPSPVRRGMLAVRPTGIAFPVKEDVPLVVPAGKSVSVFAFGLLKGEGARTFTLVPTTDDVAP